MAKTLIELSQAQPTMRPVADDEISPEDMAEIIRRVKKSERGEGRTFTSEELLEEFGQDIKKIITLLDNST